MQVAAWLRDLGLERYEQAFRAGEIDWEVLPELTDSDLEKLGLPLGPRKKLLKAIRGLCDGHATDAARSLSKGAPHPDAERRQVTVLFADVAGYTQLSRELDAEEIHALLGRFFELVDGIVKQYGGTVDKHIGDCVMAVFGAPVAHGNDAERAVRAALEIQSSIRRLSDQIDRPVGLHIGIASGQVVASSTGSDDHLEYTVTGDSVNLASRLTDAAKTGETLISDAIQRALSDRLECDEVESFVVKGFASPVRAWRLRGWRGMAGAAVRLFVGRRAELHQFEAALAACRETGCGQAIYIRGEAGIGKTRLLEEFQNVAEAAGFVYHTGLVLDFGTGTGRDAIRLLVRGLLSVGPDAAEEDTQTAAERALAEGLVEADQRVFLNDLLDLQQPPALRALYDAMDNPSRNRGKSKTVGGLVERTAHRCPLMLVVEDIHWADPLTLQHLARLAEAVRDSPALLVMTSRLEGDPLGQAWRSQIGGSPLTTIDLGPLRQQEAELLAEAYIDRSDELTQRCVERAAGNPFFLEQLLRYAGDNVPAGIPGSVQNLVEARMDRLPPPDKMALQAASVFGQRFSLDALRFVIDRPDYGCAEPVAHFLVRPRAGGFLFAHALIRDGVYDSLLKTRRRELHRRAAEWFADRDAVLYAEHLDRAGDRAASEAYLTAARRQAKDHRYNRALALAERGLELAEAGPGAFELTCTRGDVLRELGLIDLSIDAFERAARQAQLAAQKCRALLGLASGMRVVGRFEDALATLDQAEAIAREECLTRDLAQIHHLRGNLYFPLGRLDGCLEQHQLSLRLARESDAHDLEARALGGLADANYMRGRMLTAYDQYRRCVDLARERELGAVEIANWPMVGCARRYTNELREAWDDSLAAIESAVHAGNQRAEIVARQNAWLLRDMARITEARPHFERALALARSLGARLFEPINLAELAFIAAAEDDPRTASTLIEEAWLVSRETRPTFVGAWVLGVRARIAEGPDIRQDSYHEGERLLKEGCLGHNYYWFYSDAIEAALLSGDWDRAERYASALEAYTCGEPAPWSDLHIARARTLAAHGRGRRDEPVMAQIQHLAYDARRVGLHLALPAWSTRSLPGVNREALSMQTTETTLLDAVERIRPVVAEHRSRAESERELPQEVYDAMSDANLFAMLAPKAHGGLELHPIEAMRVWEAVARIDSAAAWNLVMNGTITGFIAWLPADGATEVLADGPTTVAGALFPPQPATRVEGGWRVTGQVPYASGCANAKWWALPAVEMDGAKPKVDPQTGQPAPFGVFFRREEGRILDTWHTVGMRGTGSANIAIDNLFIPDRRTMPVKPLGTPAPGFEGPLYRMVPWLSILGETTVSVGIAAAAVDALVEVAKTKTPAYMATPLREQQFAQLVAAKAKARVEASRDTLYRAAEEAYEDVEDGSLLSWDAKTRLQLAVCFAAEACAEAVRLVCDGAGASSIRTEQPFERYLRDVQVLTQHSSKSGPRYVSAGRLMFGLDNNWVWLSF